MNEDQDQFTSVQWDRNETNYTNEQPAIAEEPEVIEEDIQQEEKESHPEPPSSPDPSSSMVIGHEINEPQPIAGSSSNSSPKKDLGSPKYAIKCVVSSPLKENDGQNSFISYSIETESNNPVFKSERVKIRRRFSDFHFLYQCLLNDYPTCLIPPLPDKQRLEYIKGDRFGEEFTTKRTASLNRFLRFICNHHILSNSKILIIFLESEDWNSFKRNLNLRNSSQKTDDIITDVLMNVFVGNKKETNKEILDITEKLSKLYENLTKIDKIFHKLNKKNLDLSLDYRNFSEQITKLSEIENSNISKEFHIFNKGLIAFSDNFNNINRFIDLDYLVNLKDLENLILNFQNLINLQHSKKVDLDQLTEYLQKTKIEKDSLLGNSSLSDSFNPTQLLLNKIDDLKGINPQQQRQAKLNKLENRVQELSKEIEIQTEIVNTFEENLLNEYGYMETFKNSEIKSGLLELCNEEIGFYKNMISEWDEIEVNLRKSLEELEGQE